MTRGSELVRRLGAHVRADQPGEVHIAIIGAGGYGLPLAAFVKEQGRQAIHMGGASQILFGIKGRRWEEDPWHARRMDGIFNEYWVRPSPEETPERSESIENGCCW